MRSAYRVIAFASLVLMCVLCLCEGRALAWPRQVGPFIYAETLNISSPRLWAIDTIARAVRGPVVLPETYKLDTRSMVVTPDGRRVYIGNFGNITVMDGASGAIVATVPVGNNYSTLVASPDGTRIYVALAAAGAAKASVTTLDVATNAFVGSPATLDFFPERIAISPDGERLYFGRTLPYPTPGQLVVFDVASGKVLKSIDVGRFPNSIVATPDGRRLYVAAAIGAPNISVVDAVANETIGAVTNDAGYIPQALAMSPDGKFVYSLCVFYAPSGEFVGDFVEVVDTATNAVVGAPIKVAGEEGGVFNLIISPDGKYLYVGSLDGYVYAVDTAARKFMGRFAYIGGGLQYYGMAIVPPPPGLPYASFRLEHLEIGYGAQAGADYFNYYGVMTLNAASDGIRPDLEGLKLNIGGYVATVPPGAFKKLADGSYVYNAWVGRILYNAYVRPQGAGSYLVHLLMRNIALPAIANPAQAIQTIGNDSGLASVQATISGSAVRQAMQ